MELDDYTHKKFKYVYIPQDPDEPVVEMEYEGKEAGFRHRLKNHFSKNKLVDKAGLAATIQQQHGVSASASQDAVLECSGATYQIVPLTLPNKASKFVGINAYVDDVGQFKDYKINARATRILSSETKGDCFISTTYDDEDLFERRDFTLGDYEKYLANPPEAKGRWDPSMALNPQAKMMQQMEQMQANADAKRKALEALEDPTKCAGCMKTKEELNGKTLSRCGKCKKAAYCSRECQVADWKFHKRVCSV